MTSFSFHWKVIYSRSVDLWMQACLHSAVTPHHTDCSSNYFQPIMLLIKFCHSLTHLQPTKTPTWSQVMPNNDFQGFIYIALISNRRALTYTMQKWINNHNLKKKKLPNYNVWHCFGKLTLSLKNNLLRILTIYLVHSLKNCFHYVQIQTLSVGIWCGIQSVVQ